MVGPCYVVICINLLSTLVGILEFPNLVKLPKFTFNAGKNRKHIFLHFVQTDTFWKQQVNKVDIFSSHLLPSTTLSQSVWLVSKQKLQPRQCWLFMLDNGPSSVPVDHSSAYFLPVFFCLLQSRSTCHQNHFWHRSSLWNLVLVKFELTTYHKDCPEIWIFFFQGKENPKVFCSWYFQSSFKFCLKKIQVKPTQCKKMPQLMNWIRFDKFWF